MDSELERDSAPEHEEVVLQEVPSDEVRRADQDSVARLYVAHFRNIVLHIEETHAHRGLAEDAVQEAFDSLQKLFEKHQKLPDHPIAYLVTAARQWLIKQERDVRRNQQMPLDAVPSATLGEILQERTPVREPIQEIESTEIRDIAETAVEELDTVTRRIIRLHRNGRSWPEIAERVGLNEEIARKKFEHAVHQVRATLGAQFSSYITQAEQGVRRWIRGKRSASQAIDLLPKPYADILRMRLIDRKAWIEIAYVLDSSPDRVGEDYERGIELFQIKYGMGEAELRRILEAE